jgi:hypothetical protein
MGWRSCRRCEEKLGWRRRSDATVRFSACRQSGAPGSGNLEFAHRSTSGLNGATPQPIYTRGLGRQGRVSSARGGVALTDSRTATGAW